MKRTLPSDQLNQKTRPDVIPVQGFVTESLPNLMYRVEVTEGSPELVGKLLLCTLNGTMRRFRIRVLPGDPVLADVSIYDKGKGRITRRLRSEEELARQEVKTQ